MDGDSDNYCSGNAQSWLGRSRYLRAEVQFIFRHTIEFQRLFLLSLNFLTFVFSFFP